MHIFSTDIVTDKIDVYWEQQSQQAFQKVPVLVISTHLEEGSPATQLLTNMLHGGCKLTADQYHIIYLKDSDVLPWTIIREQVSPKLVLLFGVTPKQLGIHALFLLHEGNKFDDCIFLPAMSLPEINTQATLKQAIWKGGLQPIFELKKYGDIL
jgi:hypothetical protein